MLTGYHDSELVQFLEYGFPSNYSLERIPVPSFTTIVRNLITLNMYADMLT